MNPINSDVNNFSQNSNGDNYLKLDEQPDLMNDNFNINRNRSNHFSDEKQDSNIINLLKNNSNIYSYIYIVDYLDYEELLNLFSFILNNMMIFVSNSQSYLIVDKIVSLLY